MEPGGEGVGREDRVAIGYSRQDAPASLVPHLVGSFLGLLLLCVAGRGTFPAPALLLLGAFLVWDFVGVPVGPFEPHLLLAVALAWLGVHLVRMSPEHWVMMRSANAREAST